MTGQFRKVVRIEPRAHGGVVYHATFFECGHMYRFAAGLGPPVGTKRYCFACSHGGRQEPKVKG